MSNHVARSLSIQLGEGDQELTITVKGCDCAVPDAQMAVYAFLKEYKRQYDAKKLPVAERKPCGCKDKK